MLYVVFCSCLFSLIMVPKLIPVIVFNCGAFLEHSFV